MSSFATRWTNSLTSFDSTGFSLGTAAAFNTSDNITRVNWSAQNVQSCTVTGETGDTWTGLQSILGGNISKPITGETTYTLSCLALDGATLTKSATVRIIPTFQEL